MKPCLECKRPTSATRCPDCTRGRDRARGSATQRGYGQAHQDLRASYQRRMEAGETFDCWRCAELGKSHVVDPRPDKWQLGHSNEDRAITRGPQCSASNLNTASWWAVERGSTPQPGVISPDA